jgi:5-methylcytosine-specific restriction endonuclease McrA
MRAKAAKKRRAQVMDRDSSVCVYCGDIADTLDHLIPESLGGRDYLHNLVAACHACNNRRGSGPIPPLHPRASKAAARAVRTAKAWWRRYDSGLVDEEKRAAKIISKQWVVDPACPFND